VTAKGQQSLSFALFELVAARLGELSGDAPDLDDGTPAA